MDADCRSFRRWRAYLATIVVLVIASAPPSLHAQDVTLQSAGGTGGNAFGVSCGTNALVGFRGQGGTNIMGQGVVFNLEPWCVALNADGSWAGSPSLAGVLIGKTSLDFPTVDMLCPSHTGVSGIKGRAGSYVSDVEVVCSSIGPGGLLTSSPKSLTGSAGVTQISGVGLLNDPSYGLFQCPSNYPGKAITGRAHDWIDQIALVCGIPHEPLPVLTKVAVPQLQVLSGLTTPGTVTLNAPAPATGLVVDLHADESAFSTSPAELIFHGGQQSASFTINALPTASAKIVQIIAGLTSSPSVGASFVIAPPAMGSVSLASNYVTSGGSTTGTVHLFGKAPSGLAVSLSTGDASVATVPPTVVLGAGDTTATFPVTLAAAGGGCTYVSAAYNGGIKAAYVAIASPVGTLSRSSMKFPLGLSGQAGSTQLTVTIPAFSTPTSPTTVSLTSSNPAIVAVPATVTIPAGSTVANVGLTITNRAGVSACVTIKARDGTISSNSVILLLQGAAIVTVAN